MNSESLSTQVQQALKTVRDPSSALTKTLVEANMMRVQVVDEAAGHIRIVIESGANEHTRAEIESQARALLEPIKQLKIVEFQFVTQTGHREITSEDPLPGVRNIIMVMSGKGGVGKSTVAANLTMALARAGNRVGLLDADIYGPSVPTMFGLHGRPSSLDGKSIEPLERFGVKLMSIGFLLEDSKQAVVWRGPMLHGALQQFLKDVNWGQLEFLILDLPPGTGDVALSLSQRVRATGALIVTTPQEIALIDVYKSVSMCQKLNIPILGIVENESYFVCDGCSKKHFLFGLGGGQKVAELASAPLLAQIPLDPLARAWGDQGTPVVQAVPQSAVAKSFTELANAVLERTASVNAERIGSLTISREGMPTRLSVMR